MDNSDIRVFLESPRSMELASEIDTKPARRSQKKKRERLPPYIPFKSVYAQTDLSKLTERQRILALKFQTNQAQASSLFLAVHELQLSRNDALDDCPACSSDALALLGFLEWLAAKHSCPQHSKILNLAGQLRTLVDAKGCICTRERRFYTGATRMASYSCCLD